MTRNPLLSVENLSVDYLTPAGKVRAVHALSLEVFEGEVLGLLGESGSGKSTAAMALLRLLPAPAVISGGRVLFQGQDVLRMSDARLRAFRFRKAAIVVQSAMNALCPTLSIGSQIEDTIRCHEGSEMPTRARAIESLRLVGLDERHLNLYPHQLSGGMRQRVVIAIALALQPELVILDEPTTALDVVLQREILDELRTLKIRLGFSVLLISHDLSLMLEFCDRIGVMYAGSLVECGPKPSIVEEPLHPYTRGLFQSFPALHGPRRRLTGVPGSPPDLRALPPGCAFLPRCALGDAECSSAAPLLLERGSSHQVACFKARGAHAER
jgi:peptide/nickel transport system ATP-binding protein